MVRADYSINGQDSIYYDGELSKVEAIQNQGTGWIYGLESSIKWSFSSHFNFQANMVYTQGEDGENDPLRHVTPFMASAHFTYITSSLKVDLNGAYHGSFSNDQLAPSEKDKAYLYAIDENGLPYSPSYYLVNLQGSWFVSSHLRIDLGFENLLNQRYRGYSSGIAGAGINIKGSVVVHF